MLFRRSQGASEVGNVIDVGHDGEIMEPGAQPAEDEDDDDHDDADPAGNIVPRNLEAATGLKHAVPW